MMPPSQARLNVCMALQQVHAVMLSHHGTVRQSRQVPVASREPPRVLEETKRRRFSRRHDRRYVRSVQELFVSRSVSSCEAARTCLPRGFNSTLSFLLLSAVPPATSSTVTYTQNKGESTFHRDIQIWYMLGRYRPSTFPRAVLPNSIHLRPAVINQPRKPMPADEILTPCHYDLPLLLHVITAEPLASNSQK